MRIARNFVFWTVLAVLWTLLTRAHHPTLLVGALATGILITSFAAAVYSNQLVLIPRLWRTNQRFGYGVVLLLTMIIFTVPAVFGIQYVYDVLVGPDPLRYGFWFNFGADFAGMALHVLVASGVFGFFEWQTGRLAITHSS